MRRAVDRPAEVDGPAGPARPEGLELVLAATLAGVVPIVVAGVRAALGGWRAVGDNANFLIRARDTFTAHHPLLGTWTSASLEVGANIDNPGPLYFQLLALPAKVGDDAGLALGAAGINVITLACIAFFATRAFGAIGGATAALVATTLAWSMGSELLFDPWQPHSLLLPVLLFLILVASMAAGDVLALPVAAFVASVIVQTHLSYAVIVPLLAVAGFVALMLRSRPRDSGPTPRPRLKAALAVTAAVLALAWSQPLFEQVAGDGPGNLGKILTNAGTTGEVHGPVKAARIVADVAAVPPMWLRPSMRDAFVGRSDSGAIDRLDLPDTGTSLMALGLVAALLALVVARRRPGTREGSAGVLAGIALLLAYGTTAIAPVGIFAVPISPHQHRYLWPIAAFTAWALLVGLLAAHRRRARAVAAALVATTLIVSIAAMPSWNARTGPAADADAIPVARSLTRGMDTAGLPEPVLADLSNQRFAEPWTGPVMAELQRRGIEFRVEDEGWVGQLGPRRRASGREQVRLFVREGDAARSTPTGSERIGFASALSPADRQRLAELQERPRLTPKQRAELARLQHAADRLTVGVFVERRADR